MPPTWKVWPADRSQQVCGAEIPGGACVDIENPCRPSVDPLLAFQEKTGRADVEKLDWNGSNEHAAL